MGYAGSSAPFSAYFWAVFDRFDEWYDCFSGDEMWGTEGDLQILKFMQKYLIKFGYLKKEIKRLERPWVEDRSI